MNKDEYIKQLSHKLRRLPKEDYQKAMEYFEEYFAEAGPENEQNAISDLGTPDEAANSLIRELASENIKKQPKTVRRSLAVLWIVLLALFAAPIALPLAFTLIILVGVLLLCAGIFVFCLFITAICIIVSGIVSILGGGFLLFQSLSDGVCNIGIGLFTTGIGLLLVYAVAGMFRFLLGKTTSSLGRAMKGAKNK